MKDKDKIVTQILLVAVEYNLDIININFANISQFKDAVEFTFKDKQRTFIIRYSYENDNKYEVNNFVRFFRNELDKILKEE